MAPCLPLSRELSISSIGYNAQAPRETDSPC